MAIVSASLQVETGFTQVSNLWLRDRRLNGNSRAVLLLIASHAPGHRITKQYVFDAGIAGRDGIRKAFAQLEEFGYLRALPSRVGGRYDGHDLILSQPFVEAEDYRTVDGKPSVVEGESQPAEEVENDLFSTVDFDLPKKTSRTPKKERDVATLHPGEIAPEDAIAKRAYDATSGALPYMGMKMIARWAIRQRSTDPATVEKAIADLYRAGRTVTKQSVGQMLDGYAKIRPKQKTAREIIDDTAAQVARFKAMEEAEEQQHRLQLGTGK